ncbi:hypothetical protein AB6A40_007627 [Gnathostoma spinigerum]|uniref:Uncharacterized protein n=1 Tax=Gnathostoma spinigerum TaxID=75299 RepID=A0ABD6ELS1_9BILA
MLRWSLFKSPQSNNIFVLFYCILLWNLSTITYALRCKCTTSKGATRCDGDFCDVHALNGKRGACGMVRFERETHFACVRINASSNDTYCHVVKGATACWCRDRDFCNVDIELDLEKQQRQSSVDEEMDEDDDVDGENWADDQVFMGGVQVAEDVAGDPFVIEATQIDGMAAVEYQPAERVDEVKKIRVSPEAKTTPPLLPIIQYIDNFGDDDDGYDSEDWNSVKNCSLVTMKFPSCNDKILSPCRRN